MTIEKIDLHVGDRVLLRQRTRWTVAAVTKHFAALVQQAPFRSKGTMQYTVIDWRNGIRGPCNLIGQGYGDGSYSPEQCSRMLSEFEDMRLVGEYLWPELEVSHRNRVPLDIRKVEPISG